MVECLVALAIMSVGLLGLTELSVQRLQHINTTHHLFSLIAAASDAAILAQTEATLPSNSGEPTPYTARLENNSSGPLSHLVVAAAMLPHTTESIAIRLPVHSLAEAP